MNKLANEILSKHEDRNEMHFHGGDREFIIEAMEEYSQATMIDDIEDEDTKAIVKVLKDYNNWRRDNDGLFEQPSPQVIGCAIDEAIKILSNL